MSGVSEHSERLLAIAEETGQPGDARAAADSLHADAERAYRRRASGSSTAAEALREIVGIAGRLLALSEAFPGEVPPPK